ncbi:Uncharacterised protein [Segatella copri]|nr:Uncharacterised protein [Segatella copri]
MFDSLKPPYCSVFIAGNFNTFVALCDIFAVIDQSMSLVRTNTPVSTNSIPVLRISPILV